MKNIIEPSEMPLNADSSVYHLHLQPEQIAQNCILVGDPGRVPQVSRLFDRIDFKMENRELITHTGELNGKRISVLSTGMGIGNIDIVINELDALVNIDLKTREVKKEHQSLNLIRLGTCGSLQPDYKIGSFCGASYALGLDGLLNYYKLAEQLLQQDMINAFIEHAHFSSDFAKPYILKASESLRTKVAFAIPEGISVTAPGFFGPQGRQLRLELAQPDLNHILSSFRFQGQRISNLEMETAAIYGLGQALGHKTLSICLIIANRVHKDFLEDIHPGMDKLIETVLERFLA